jgi:hypothetical protein
MARAACLVLILTSIAVARTVVPKVATHMTESARAESPSGRMVAEFGAWNVSVKDVPGGATLWAWAQDGIAEIDEVYLADDGSAVLIDRWQQVHHVDAAGRHRRLIVRSPGIDHPERSPAGGGWMSPGIRGIMQDRGDWVFFRRAWGGEYQIVDMKTGNVLTDSGRAARLEGLLADDVRGWLSDRNKVRAAGNHRGFPTNEAAYAFVIKKNGIKEGYELLDALLQSDYRLHTSNCLDEGKRLSDLLFAAPGVWTPRQWRNVAGTAILVTLLLVLIAVYRMRRRDQSPVSVAAIR